MTKISKISLAALLFFGFARDVFACGGVSYDSFSGRAMYFLYIAVIAMFAYLFYLIITDKIKYKHKKTALFLFTLLLLFIILVIAIIYATLTATLCGYSSSF
jgi:FtsH-binding integral membrane protein